MPRARPAGGAVPQPALLAARFKAPRGRGALPSRSRRNSYGSRLAAWASSSMKLSTAKALKELFTERQNPTGIPESVRDRKSTRLNSSHSQISYAVFCLKKKKKKTKDKS